jgi:hypothetical protein
MPISIKSFQPAGSNTLFLANWMGWFEGVVGNKHIGGVCRSDDPRTIKAQVDMMQAVGIDGAIIDWYGPNDNPTNQASLMLMTELERRGMKFSIMLDSGIVKWLPAGVDRNAAMVDAINYCKANFVASPAYVQWKGKPLFFEFGTRIPLNFSIASVEVKFPELTLAYQDHGMDTTEPTFAWVNGFPNNGLGYLKGYLSTADVDNSIPCVFSGFDDHKASDPTQSVWGGPARFIDSNYGNTWRGCFELINAKYTTAPKIIQVATWNDYEERTAIEPIIRGITGTKLY